MLVIGLTGGIGTGKSTVSQFLQDLGAALVDADKVGHESYTPGTPTYNELVAEFGDRIVAEDRQIDRKALGGIVFGDPAKLSKLNGIVHPRMRGMMGDKLGAMKSKGTKVVVLEAAILIEANWTPLVDEVWVTDAPEEAVIERVEKRSGFPREQIMSRIQSQLPVAERNTKADVVIDTGCTLEEVKQKVQGLWDQRVAGVA